MTAEKLNVLLCRNQSWQRTLEISGICHKLSRIELDMAGMFIAIREREWTGNCFVVRNFHFSHIVRRTNVTNSGRQKTCQRDDSGQI